MFFAGGRERRCGTLRYAGIRKGSGDALCGNTEENGRCFMREYEGERAVCYAGIRKGSGGEEIAAWRQVAAMGR